MAARTLWTLEEAVSLIRELEPLVRALNYHTLLGGSVLHVGKTEKDLDLFFSPLNGYESDSKVILKLLFEQLGPATALRDGPDYGPDAHPHWLEMMKFTYLGKRIDVFIQ